MKNSVEFWDGMSENYDNQISTKYVKTYKKTVEMTQKYLKKSDNVLDFGCGTGITTVKLSENVARIHAIDSSDKMINIARKKVFDQGLSNVDFKTIALDDVELNENSYDVILAFNVLYFIKDIDSTLDKVSKLLKPGGLFISATDCLGEKKSIFTLIQMILSKVGMIPFMQHFRMQDLENKIHNNEFEILEKKNLFDLPPNYFIVARKAELSMNEDK